MAPQGYKRCNRCGETKSVEEFRRNHRMKDGRLNQCKACVPRPTREQRRQQKINQRERTPEKHRARIALNRAVARGWIEKPTTCEDCGEQFEKHEIQGHHHDYSKPRDVAWLCASCHRARHAQEAQHA